MAELGIMATAHNQDLRCDNDSAYSIELRCGISIWPKDRSGHFLSWRRLVQLVVGLPRVALLDTLRSIVRSLLPSS
jgi:hypothetical protein